MASKFIQMTYQRVVVIYALVGILWIVGSDWLLVKVWGDFDKSVIASIVKGISFILLMSTVLYCLLRKLSVAEGIASASSSNEQLFLYKAPGYFKQVPFITYAIEVTDHKVRSVWVSSNIERVLGYSSEKAMSRQWWEKHLHPEDKLRAIEESQAIFKNGGGDHYYRFRHASGDYIHIHDELRLLGDSQPNRFIGIMHDVSIQEDPLNQARVYSGRLENTVMGTIKAISGMVEMRDPYTAGHESRVGDLAVAIASEMGLDANTQYGLRIAGLVHDIGKISIPAEYLTKPTRLTESEFNIIKTHPENGYQILKNVEFPWPVAEVARQHHERIDGTGYPLGLKGDQILLESKIVAVADVIESMATSRPYRHALGLDKALDEIEKNAGKLYDTEVAEATLRLFKDKRYVLQTTV